MAYLILDPVDEYAGEMMSFLARQLDLGAVAVFSSRKKYLLWQHKWSQELGQHVLASYLATKEPDVTALAARIAHDWPELDGIIPWDEITILLGAELGERLGLGWNSLAVIERCRDKHVMKDWLRRASNVRINAGGLVRRGEEALAFQEMLGRWPVVVKPTEGAGSSHVYFAENRGDLLGACQKVLESGSGEVLLEEYVGGQEFAVNGIADATGDFLVTDVWRYDRRTSHGQPNIYFQTIKVGTGEAEFAWLGAYAADVIEALGLRRAPVHMEVKLDRRGPCLIEIGARLAGGNLPTIASKLHGRSLLELAACHYIGKLPAQISDISYVRYDSFHARVLTGVQTKDLAQISAVRGLERVKALPSFDGIGLLRAVGTPAPQTRDLDTRAWELYLIHPDAQQIARDAELAHELLRYE